MKVFFEINIFLGLLKIAYSQTTVTSNSITTSTVELWLILLASLLGVFFIAFLISAIIVCFYLYKEYAKKARLDKKDKGFGFTIMRGRKSLALGVNEDDVSDTGREQSFYNVNEARSPIQYLK
ncbi:unnamed protein product [Brachionus calyciflorus]|uniref:Uncharacterized protein n=1 Tax=Brachionus calyciflorus TaxID=104777 RepID=A0A813YIP8_9BILA|nr:unnamed protein product [Brachionus calyciflorus]